jgi:cytochrome c-type biogenesis protein CcmF
MHPELPNAPALGLLAGDVGRALVFAAIGFYVLSALGWLRGGRTKVVGSAAFWIASTCVVATMAVLVSLLLAKQYQFEYVWQNTENAMPTAYRFSAAWASQEGSFLLWATTSAVIAAVAARFTAQYRRWFTVAASLLITCMLVILAYESPFKIHPELLQIAKSGAIPMPPDGNGLNPTLQNYWMVIHPWVIFLGFGSLLTLFCWAFSAVASRDFTSWVPQVRPWALASMTLTGVGLTMGGLWAYETLGWGGFWAWDPVENVSLVPFLACVALVHGLYLQANRGAWTRWNVILSLLPFGWFVYGTYLTRSGALVNVSVHSFAEMNKGAHGVLLGMTSIVWLAILVLAYLALRRRIDISEQSSVGKRGAWLKYGMGIVYSIAIMAAFGMSLPFFASVFRFSTKIVEEGRYNQIVAWPFVPAMLLMAIVPFFGWKQSSNEEAAHKRSRALTRAFFFSVVMFGLIVFFVVRSGLTIVDGFRMPFLKLVVFYTLIWVTLFAVSANLVRCWERLRARAGGVGAFVTHSGVSILLLGLIVSRVFEREEDAVVSSSQAGFFDLAYDRTYLTELSPDMMSRGIMDPNNRLLFTITDVNQQRQMQLAPNFFINQRDGNFVTRPSIKRRPLYDLYFFVQSLELTYGEKIALKPGESASQAGFSIKYYEPYREGEPGQPGTKFGAKLRVSYEGGESDAVPAMELSEAGMVDRPARVNDDLTVYLDSLDAGDMTATISLMRPEPLFVTKLFFKPLTMLVWIGAGMMTLGGILSIWRRARPRRSAA